MTGPLYFLLQLKLIWLAILSFKSRLYDFNATIIQIENQNCWIFFVFLVLSEILPRYPYIDSLHWLREDVQWVIDKVFREQFMV